MDGAALGLLLAALVVALSRAAHGGMRVAGTALTLFGVLWYLVGGLVGTALLLAATVTKHAPYMGSNLSLLLFHPLLLLVAVLWAWRAAAGRAGRAVRAMAILSAGFAVVALVLIHIPGFTQGSMIVVFAVLPVHVALAWAARNAKMNAAPRLPQS